MASVAGAITPPSVTARLSTSFAQTGFVDKFFKLVATGFGLLQEALQSFGFEGAGLAGRVSAVAKSSRSAIKLFDVIGDLGSPLPDRKGDGLLRDIDTFGRSCFTIGDSIDAALYVESEFLDGAFGPDLALQMGMVSAGFAAAGIAAGTAGTVADIHRVSLDLADLNQSSLLSRSASRKQSGEDDDTYTLRCQREEEERQRHIQVGNELWTRGVMGVVRKVIDLASIVLGVLSSLSIGPKILSLFSRVGAFFSAALGVTEIYRKTGDGKDAEKLMHEAAEAARKARAVASALSASIDPAASVAPSAASSAASSSS